MEARTPEAYEQAAARLGRAGREPRLCRRGWTDRLVRRLQGAAPPELGRPAAGAGRWPLRMGRLPRPRRPAALGRSRPGLGRDVEPEQHARGLPERGAQARLRIRRADAGAADRRGAERRRRAFGRGRDAASDRRCVSAGTAARGPARRRRRRGSGSVQRLGPPPRGGQRRGRAFRGLVDAPSQARAAHRRRRAATRRWRRCSHRAITRR